MKRIKIVAVCLAIYCAVLISINSSAAGQPSLDDLTLLEGRPSLPEEQLASVCRNVNALNNRIRDERVNDRSARIDLKRLLTAVSEGYGAAGGAAYRASDWIFPLAGHDSRAVSGGRSHGYSARGYDFFSGNRHGGHPSYDIFIRDRNQDGLDDRTGQPVQVLSMTGGVVVALEGEWEKGSKLRGGKYVWVYDPINELLVYYAHNAELTVVLGEIVKPGDVLGVVGRSGFNAAKRRSPTHLHLTVLNVQNGKIVPVKIFQALQRAHSLPGRRAAVQKEASRSS